MLLFRPPETASHLPVRLRYFISKAPDDSLPAMATSPEDGIVHLARWNGASYDAMAECWEHGLHVAISAGSRIAGLVRSNIPPSSLSMALRKKLYQRQRDPQWCAETVRQIIDAKIGNQYGLLRLYHDRPQEAWHGEQQRTATPSWGERYSTSLQLLRQNRQTLAQLNTLASIRGIEGRAARNYFGAWPPLLATLTDNHFRRQARSCHDPINLLLDLSYARLAQRVTLHLLDAGLDVAAGMLHSDDDGRPSLALDLMEPLRPSIADRFCLRLLRRQGKDWFTHDGSRWHLSTLGRREMRQRWQDWLTGNSKREGHDHTIADCIRQFKEWILAGKPLNFPRLR